MQTLDTQAAPVARTTVTHAQAPGEWEGFWCLSVEKAPQGAFDDVFITLDPALPQWFTLDAAQPLRIAALPAGVQTP